MKPLLRMLADAGIAVLSAAGALVIVLLFLAALGYPPAAVMREWFSGAAGESTDLWRSVREACPLVFTGLAAGVAFRCGVFNIGGEGQFMAGAITALAVVAAIPGGAPPVLAVPLAILAGALAGAMVAAIPAALERWRNVPLVLSTILLNIVLLHIVRTLINGPLADPGVRGQSVQVPAAFELPVLQEASGIHIGVLVALLVVIALWAIQSRTRFGFEMLVTGHNPVAAELAGMPIRRRAFEVMAISGALAGLGGAIQLTGGAAHFVSGSMPGYGFTGIAVALLGRLHPIGIAAAALFFGMLERGAQYVETDPNLHLSHNSADAVKGIILLVLLAAGAWAARWRARRVKAEPLATEGAAHG